MIYTPPAFVSNVHSAISIAITHPFATLITPQADSEPWLSHLLLLPNPANPMQLFGHLARANPHCQYLLTQPSVALFHGEHGYISPLWYGSDKLAVPTWNYRVAHAHGQASELKGNDLLQSMAESVMAFEGSNGWQLADQPALAIDRLLSAVVGFIFNVSRWDCKEKLSQNHHPREQQGVVQALAHGQADDQALATVMAQRLDLDAV